MAPITNSKNVKEISWGAEDLKQVKEIYEQLTSHKCENINGHNGIPRAGFFNFIY